MEFGPRLRAAREARGWSLAQLAARIPADKGQLSRVERGQRTPATAWCAAPTNCCRPAAS
jgi:transcriptional regulator with XRE-family HTH domain